MKKTITLLLLFPSLFLVAQSYHPFAVPGCVWTVDGKGDDSGFQYYWKEYYTFKGDTALQGKKYRIVTGIFDDSRLMGYVREENRKVYFLEANCQQNPDEFCIYDFNILPGDTFRYRSPECWPGSEDRSEICINKDSVQLANGEYRTRWQFESGWGPCTAVEWIEGIGSTMGPFAAVTFYPPCFESMVRLGCVCYEGSQIYGDPQYTGNYCLTLKVDDIREQPVSHIRFAEGTLEVFSHHLMEEAILFNALGQQLALQRQPGNYYRIDVSGYSAQVLFLVCRDQSRSTTRKIFIP